MSGVHTLVASVLLVATAINVAYADYGNATCAAGAFFAVCTSAICNAIKERR